jgi:hypothetical protein
MVRVVHFMFHLVTPMTAVFPMTTSIMAHVGVHVAAHGGAAV